MNFGLRFCLANAIIDYLRLKIRVVCVGIFNLNAYQILVKFIFVYQTFLNKCFNSVFEYKITL